MIWHNKTAEAVARELSVDPARGLTDVEAAVRLQEHGVNRLETMPSHTAARRFLNQFRRPAILVLLAVALLSLGMEIYAVLRHAQGDWLQPALLLVATVGIAAAGALRQRLALRASLSLQTRGLPDARVWRDGAEQTIPATALVAGDVLLLREGDCAAADCRLLDAQGLYCDQSALTGDAQPAEKDAAAVLPAIASVAERRNMVYAGSLITAGQARGLVVEIGMNTERGHTVSLRRQERANRTSLEQRLAALERPLRIASLVACAIVFLLGIGASLPWRDVLVLTAVLAAAVPDSLSTVAAVVLARGAERMAKDTVVIRHREAVEAFSSASVICTDKSGLLAQENMTLVRAFADHHMAVLTKTVPEDMRMLVRLAALCTGDDTADPVETAIIAYLRRDLEKEELIGMHPRLGEIPFDADRRCMTAIHLIADHKVVIVRGAPETVLARCTSGDLDEARDAVEFMSAEALHVLAIAYKFIDNVPVTCEPDELENNLTFIGLLGLTVPVQDGAAQAVAACANAGIRTVMVTGDNGMTATASARKLGLLEDARLSLDMLAADTAGTADADLCAYRVFSRATPADRLRIVKAFRHAGETVVFAGDNSDDIEVIRAADVGCARGEACTGMLVSEADALLPRREFTAVAEAIRACRALCDGMRQAVLFLLIGGLAALFGTGVALLLQGQLPFAPLPLLLWQFALGFLPAFAFGNAKGGAMRRPSRAHLFSKRQGLTALVQVVLITALTLIAFSVGGQTAAFATLALSELLLALSMQSDRLILGIQPYSAAMPLLFLGLLAWLLVMLLCPPLRHILLLSAMTAETWRTVVCLSLLPLLLSEGIKLAVAVIRKRSRT